jgi:hypothetical protein
MIRLFRRFAAILFFAMLLTGCAPAPTAVPVEKMPRNYRALIAQYIKSREPFDKKELSTAKISEPYTDGAPGYPYGSSLLGGEPIHVVCVSVNTCNMLGMCGDGYLQYTVKNGQIQRLKSGATAIISSVCGPFSTFHEVMQR